MARQDSLDANKFELTVPREHARHLVAIMERAAEEIGTHRRAGSPMLLHWLTAEAQSISALVPLGENYPAEFDSMPFRFDEDQD